MQRWLAHMHVLQPGACELQRPKPAPKQPSGHMLPSQLAAFVPAAHVMSHAHESEQSMSRHDDLPEQVTLHLPSPHERSRHELLPLQMTVHDLAFVQSIPDVHEFVVVQPTVQFQPTGQTTSLLQLVVAQSMTHSWPGSRQLVHCEGHVVPSGEPSRGPSITGPISSFASVGPPDVTQ
jgi:hypothetical protein